MSLCRKPTSIPKRSIKLHAASKISKPISKEGSCKNMNKYAKYINKTDKEEDAHGASNVNISIENFEFDT